MSNAGIRAEVKSLIRFYEQRGWDWTSAATFTLLRLTGNLDRFLNPWDRRRYRLTRISRGERQ